MTCGSQLAHRDVAARMTCLAGGHGLNALLDIGDDEIVDGDVGSEVVSELDQRRDEPCEVVARARP